MSFKDDAGALDDNEGVSMDELIEAEKFVNEIKEEINEFKDEINIKEDMIAIEENITSSVGEEMSKIEHSSEDSEDCNMNVECELGTTNGLNTSDDCQIAASPDNNNEEVPASSGADETPLILQLPNFDKPLGLCVGAYFCPSCKYSTRLRGDLKRHIAVVHFKEKPFQCTDCGYKASQKCHLTTHIRAVHIRDKIFQCGFCQYSCTRKSSLNRHLITIHRDKGFTKDSIAKTRISPYYYIEDESDESKLNNAESGLFMDRAEKAGLMAAAEAVQLIDNAYKCPRCEYSTKWKGDLHRHVAFVHIGDKPYHCPDCSYQAKQKSHLNIHIKSVHMKDKSYKCPECDYQCSRGGSLNRHIMTIHKGVKPYHCPECQYQASQSGNLKYHFMIVHRGEKPFHCPHCSYQATKRDTINKHIKTLHENVDTS